MKLDLIWFWISASVRVFSQTSALHGGVLPTRVQCNTLYKYEFDGHADHYMCNTIYRLYQCPINISLTIDNFCITYNDIIHNCSIP